MNFVIELSCITNLGEGLEYPTTMERIFSPVDCTGNTVALGKNKALFIGSTKSLDKTSMWIGSYFLLNVQVGEWRTFHHHLSYPQYFP